MQAAYQDLQHPSMTTSSRSRGANAYAALKVGAANTYSSSAPLSSLKMQNMAPAEETTMGGVAISSGLEILSGIMGSSNSKPVPVKPAGGRPRNWVGLVTTPGFA